MTYNYLNYLAIVVVVGIVCNVATALRPKSTLTQVIGLCVTIAVAVGMAIPFYIK